MKSKVKSFTLFSISFSQKKTIIECLVNSNGSFEAKGRIRTQDMYILHKRWFTKKKRGLGFRPICLKERIPDCEWHHVNKNDVTQIPRYIHNNFYHELKDGSALKLEGVTG